MSPLSSRSAAGLTAVVLGFMLAQGSAAHAEDWAMSGLGADGVFETDVSSINHEGGLVRSWTRLTLTKARRDEASGKPYVVDLQERFDDCEHNRFQLGTYVRRDAQGTVAGTGSTLSAGWQSPSPGSIAASISRLACAVANPPADPPFEAEPDKGAWSDLGVSGDGKYRLQVKIDEVIKLSDGPVMALSRTLYAKPELIDGLPIRLGVIANAIDCAHGKSASLGADLFVTPTVRVKAFRVADKDIHFETAPPNSFLARSLPLICAAARPETPETNEAHGFSVGTAWATNKGYLVTASHVIESGGKIAVYNNGDKVGEAEVVVNDPTNDLAVLKFKPAKPGKLTILPLATKPTSLGRSIFVLGYPEPDSLGQRIKMTAGQVSSTAGYQDDARFLQISAAVQQGNSGGPVIGWDGSAVGVVESKLTKFGEDATKLAPEMVNYALKVSYVRAMLEELPDLANYAAVKATGDNDQIVAEARKAVFMVLVTPPS